MCKKLFKKIIIIKREIEKSWYLFFITRDSNDKNIFIQSTSSDIIF